MSKPYIPITCATYDYLEIACMDAYSVELQLDDVTCSGVAKTLVNEHGEEFLVLADENDRDMRVRVDTIRCMKVLTRPSRFTAVQFDQD